MTKAMPFLQKYDITFLRPPTISPAVFLLSIHPKGLQGEMPLFTLLSFGSGFKVQVAASPPFLEDGTLVSQPSPLGEVPRRGG